ncbi:MAG: nucleotidyl transferase AbiEii/AbiGii toxin family protein [Candidatus Staskawiczbacteria bacterium]|nr:nucleotidyl transferase AbiEii/AbiGii toxin family protein [Candidatus Staskawiczbacteria bacterium]
MELFPIQKKVLDLFKESNLNGKFYWTGGTMLSFVYLKHRLSVDLDFFSDVPFSYGDVAGFVNDLKSVLKLSKVEGKKIFDRYEFFLTNSENVRLEFVFYNFPALTPRKKWEGILIDSLDDIAANKTMAFFDRNEVKDLFDIYFLIKKAKFTPLKLLELVENKFGVKFSEGSFWSESFKSFDKMENLMPFLISKNESGKAKILDEIREYFIKNSKDFLDEQLK